MEQTIPQVAKDFSACSDLRMQAVSVGNCELATLRHPAEDPSCSRFQGLENPGQWRVP